MFKVLIEFEDSIHLPGSHFMVARVPVVGDRIGLVRGLNYEVAVVEIYAFREEEIGLYAVDENPVARVYARVIK